MRLFMRYPGGHAKALTFSYDDGVLSDIRFMNILAKYGMKATFNINTGIFMSEDDAKRDKRPDRRMTERECIDAYKNSPHEVAVHSVTHPCLECLPPCEATAEILNDRTRLEELYSTFVRGGAYPYGTYSDTVVEILKNCGIEYFRTTVSTHKMKLPDNWLTLHPTCHHNDERLGEITDNFLAATNERYPLLLYVWGHTYEFDRDDNWHVIEDFCEKFREVTNVWYCTNIELFDYVKAYTSLVFSADCNCIYNPTQTDLWISRDDIIYEIKAGETLNLR